MGLEVVDGGLAAGELGGFGVVGRVVRGLDAGFEEFEGFAGVGGGVDEFEHFHEAFVDGLFGGVGGGSGSEDWGRGGEALAEVGELEEIDFRFLIFDFRLVGGGGWLQGKGGVGGGVGEEEVGGVVEG